MSHIEVLELSVRMAVVALDFARIYKPQKAWAYEAELRELKALLAKEIECPTT